MKHTAGKSAGDSPWVEMYDLLIERSIRELLEQDKVNAKLGEVIKMIENRDKRVPSGADQKRFWKLVEEIRQGKGSDPPKKKAGRGKRATREKKKK